MFALSNWRNVKKKGPVASGYSYISSREKKKGQIFAMVMDSGILARVCVCAVR